MVGAPERNDEATPDDAARVDAGSSDDAGSSTAAAIDRADADAAETGDDGEAGDRSGVPGWIRAIPSFLERTGAVAAVGGRRAQGALNGLLGHELHDMDSPLAVDLVVEPFPDQPVRGHLVVLVHGLMATEDVWAYKGDPGTTYGSLLADALDGTALFVRYNTGRRIGDNGDDLAAALDELVDTWPVPVTGITLVGHSMGGLVVRSAAHHGTESGRRWPGLVDRVFLLGAPHSGAPLESLAHYAALGLAAVPLAYVRVVAEVLDQRSHGIKDLRHGHLLVADPGTDGHADTAATPIPLLEGAEHFVVAGHVGPTPGHVTSLVLGDWLVPVRSARRVPVPDDHVVVVPRIGHMALMHDTRIGEQLVAWATGRPGPLAA